MRLFIDLEFVERGRDLPLQIISIGMIREDGTEFYRINPECLSNVAKHAWLSQYVAPYLPIKASPGILEWNEEHEEYQYVARSLDHLVDDVLIFIRETPDVEIWSFYGHYDHVCLHQLFGSMNEQPAGVPMFTHDVQELVIRHPDVELPQEAWRIHHAMEDARWTREAYGRLTESERPLALAAKMLVTEDAEIIE